MQCTDEDNRREHQLQELVTTTAVWTTQNSDGAGGLDPQWWKDLQISGPGKEHREDLHEQGL